MARATERRPAEVMKMACGRIPVLAAVREASSRAAVPLRAIQVRPIAARHPWGVLHRAARDHPSAVLRRVAGRHPQDSPPLLPVVVEADSPVVADAAVADADKPQERPR